MGASAVTHKMTEAKLEAIQKSIDETIVRESQKIGWDAGSYDLDFDSKLAKIVDSMMIQGYRPITAVEYARKMVENERIYIWKEERDDFSGGGMGLVTEDTVNTVIESIFTEEEMSGCPTKEWPKHNGRNNSSYAEF